MAPSLPLNYSVLQQKDMLFFIIIIVAAVDMVKNLHCCCNINIQVKKILLIICLV